MCMDESRLLKNVTFKSLMGTYLHYMSEQIYFNNLEIRQKKIKNRSMKSFKIFFNNSYRYYYVLSLLFVLLILMNRKHTKK